MTDASESDARLGLLGRSDVLGHARTTAEISAAFASSGEACFAAPGPLATPGPTSKSHAGVARDVARLLNAMAGRLGVDSWLLAYGTSPDDLSEHEEVIARVPKVAQALKGAEDEELIHILAILAHPDRISRRHISERAQLLLRRKPNDQAAITLALPTRYEGIARRLAVFQTQGGPEASFWLADTSLTVRFSFRRSGVAFRAHHPVIQESLEARCKRDGIDLL